VKTVQRVRIKQVRDGSVRFAVDQIKGPAEVYEAVRGYYRGEDREILSALYLDARNVSVCFQVVSIGTRNTTQTSPADVLKPAILSNASSLILIHNHPSGDLEPSREDIAFTKSMRAACELVGIAVHDHLVISDDGFVSLKARGDL
jgi:DNA repair protein RadC